MGACGTRWQVDFRNVIQGDDAEDMTRCGIKRIKHILKTGSRKNGTGLFIWVIVHKK